MDDRYFFRAKRIDNGEWVKGYLVETRHNTYHDGYRIIDKDGINYDELDYYEPSFISYVIDPSTICQCTGLKDKNGKLIWENDIVNCLEEECFGKISWNESEAGFYFDALLEDGTCEEENIYDYADCMEVIGNIFDNTELMHE